MSHRGPLAATGPSGWHFPARRYEYVRHVSDYI
jgi:hypothetical protein